jgi:hypothetical protein
MSARMRRLEQGGLPICPEVYKVRSRDERRRYVAVLQFDAAVIKEIESEPCQA